VGWVRARVRATRHSAGPSEAATARSTSSEGSLPSRRKMDSRRASCVSRARPAPHAARQRNGAAATACADDKVANRDIRVLALRDRKGSLNDGQIQNPSEPFGIVPLSNFVPRGFGFVHHSIAILYHEVPNLSITIRNLFIAVRPGDTRNNTRRGSTPLSLLPPSGGGTGFFSTSKPWCRQLLS
jgi:hypothetical protein